MMNGIIIFLMQVFASSILIGFILFIVGLTILAVLNIIEAIKGMR